MTQLETQLIEKLRTLPTNKQSEVIDFIEFLAAKATIEPHDTGIPPVEVPSREQTIQHIDQLRTRLHHSYGDFSNTIEMIRQDRER